MSRVHCCYTIDEEDVLMKMKRIRFTGLIAALVFASAILGSVDHLHAAEAASKHKFAIILPGPIEDADYNFRSL